MMARRRSKTLTDRQKKILDVLEKFQQNTGYPPSIREICDQAGISSTSVVNYYLIQLEDMGYIQRDNHVSRGIRLVMPLSQILGTTTATLKTTARQSIENISQVVGEMLHIPLVGRIVAGSPVPIPSSDFSYYDPDSMIDLSTSLLPPREKGAQDLFALEVKGDSMIDAMVNDGDLVIMKPAAQAHNGEMVAVRLIDRDEFTLKYFYLENDRIRLQPANPTMEPTLIDDPSIVSIQGKVVMVIRKVGGLAS